jgi:hypothetical protein
VTRSFPARLAAGAAALLALAVLLIGLPWLLAATIGNPLPAEVPSPAQAWAALTGRDSGSLLLRVLACAAWAAWASFAASVVVEIPAAIRSAPTPHLPGMRGQQRLAAALVGAVILVFAAPVTSASAAPLALAAVAYEEPAPNPSFQSPLTAPDTSETMRLQFDTSDTMRLQVAPDDGGTATEPGIYTVEEGDYLGYVAERYTGDFNNYPDLAEAAGIDDPDEIRPGDQIPLPADAVDAGPIEHAAGDDTMTSAPAESDDGTPDEEPPAPDDELGDDGSDEPTAADPGAGDDATDTPEATATPETDATEEELAPTGEPETTAASPDPESAAASIEEPTSGSEDVPTEAHSGMDLSDAPAILAATAALGGATLLAGLLVLALHRRRRRHAETREPGTPLPASPDPVTEQALHAAADPVTLARLDAALRRLAADLPDASDRPDPVAAWIDDGTFHLLLADPHRGAPAPWTVDDSATTWTLAADTETDSVDDHLNPPLPALATIASRRNTHLLLDCERLGLVTLTGDTSSGEALLRYLACELASNAWAGEAAITVCGFNQAETAALTSLLGDRLTVADDAAAALATLRQQANRAIASLKDLDLDDTLAGRINDTGADAWGPALLLVNQPDPAGAKALAEAADLLENAGRCAVAVIACHTEPLGRWNVDLANDGALRVDFLGIGGPADSSEPMYAAGLADTDLAAIAAVLAAADSESASPAETAAWPIIAIDPEAAPADPSDDLFNVVELDLDDTTDDNTDTGATDTDPAAAEEMVEEDADFAAALTGTAPPLLPLDLTANRLDPGLDDDLAAWHRADTSTPRIAVLGEVSVAASGHLPDKQIRLHQELIVYLAQCSDRGATGAAIDAALWPDDDPTRAAAWRRSALTRARKWLGDTPDGHRWLPELAGGKHYRLREGVLCDWRLFDRATRRAQHTGAADLEAALGLVTGEPMTGSDYHSPRSNRTPYAWATAGPLTTFGLVGAITDAAHALVTEALNENNIVLARWAIDQARLADPERHTRTIWHDAMRIAHTDGKTGELQALVAELAERQDCEVLEDLDAQTFALLRELDPALIGSGAWT